MSFESKIFKILGLHVEGDKLVCNDRKGVLHVRTPDGWEPAMFNEEDHSTPYVCACGHEALEALREIARDYLVSKLASAFTGEQVKPFFQAEDFMYVYEEDMAEPEVNHTQDADSIINKIKGV